VTTKKGGVAAPFDTYNRLYQNRVDQPFEAFSASAVSGRDEQAVRNAQSSVMPASVSLPKHLFIPEDAQALNFLTQATFAVGVNNILSFKAPANATTFFFGYALSVAGAGVGVSMNLLINGARGLPYNGDPDSGFAFNTFSDSTLVPLADATLFTANLQLQPGDVMVWSINNASGGPVVAGVKMLGFVDTSTIRKQGRFGG
jgi:hypothetical protein